MTKDTLFTLASNSYGGGAWNTGLFVFPETKRGDRELRRFIDDACMSRGVWMHGLTRDEVNTVLNEEYYKQHPHQRVRFTEYL